MVPVFHAPPGRTPGECLLHREKHAEEVKHARQQGAGVGSGLGLLVLWLDGFLLPRLVAAVRGRKRQTRSIPHQLPLLIGEHALKLVGVNHVFALISRHGAEIVNRCMYHPAPVGRKLPHLPEHLSCLLLLLGSQMLPRVHAIKDLNLPLWRETRKVLQPLSQYLLPDRREFLERGIVRQGTFLLFGRQIFVLPQPVARVACLLLCLRTRDMLLRRRSGMCRCRMGSGFLRQTKSTKQSVYRHNGDSCLSRDLLSPWHDSRLSATAVA